MPAYTPPFASGKRKTMKKSIDYKSIYEPPGGILLWMIIMVELLTFGIALIVLVASAGKDPGGFHESARHLNRTFGAVNTIFLLTSGYFMAMAVRRYKQEAFGGAARAINFALLGGLLFVLLKGFEYHEKIDAGLVLGYNSFFNFYWLLTGFHLIHVLVGMIILFFIRRGIAKGSSSLEDVEAGAAFWHMCDLIWLLLFPTLYLVL